MDDLLRRFESGDIRALSRVITHVETRAEGYETMMARLYERRHNRLVMGITGPPGAGKSTLVDKLIGHYRAAGETVAVVAIDPSSPFTGGAILGDRIRMQRHASDTGVFVRSIGTRGAHGGLSRAAGDVVTVLDAFGWNRIIVETVGVGQTELDIMALADCTTVVMVPEAGDTVQTLKAGLLEIADIFVVNKSDREGALAMEQALKGLVSLVPSSEDPIPVLKTVATRDEGIDPWIATIDTVAARLMGDPQRVGEKRRQWVESICLDRLRHVVLGALASPEGAAILREVVDGGRNPYEAADAVIGRICIKK